MLVASRPAALSLLLGVALAVRSSGPFTCHDGAARPNVTACDGVWQCPGGEDEVSCEACTHGALYCGGECFAAHRVCDGFPDCPAGEDEKGCENTTARPAVTQAPAAAPGSCRGGRFDCGGGHCIDRRYLCDGGSDCSSGEDELNCRECQADSFRCYSGWCEHKARCDGTRQCPAGEDEAGCGRTDPASLFTCRDGTTRLATTRCDGWLACPGGEDEHNCTAALCRDGAFFCGGVCKPPSRRCDGVRQCPSGEDEEDCSGQQAPPPPPAVCGRATGGPDTLVVNGTKAESGAFPWHAALYQRQRDGELKFICGASLISSTVLITAAHCVYLGGRTVPASLLTVGLGKLYSGWDAEPFGVHKSNVTEVVVHPDYVGVLGKHAADIAVLHIEKAAPESQTIAPVCLGGGAGTLLRPGNYITVVGWGNGSSPLVELESVNIPYLARRDCLHTLRKSRPQELSYITFDKFCAIRETGVVAPGGLAQGDSGGGVVVRRDSRWYLLGVVSLSLDNGRISAFTNATASDILAWVAESS